MQGGHLCVYYQSVGERSGRRQKKVWDSSASLKPSPGGREKRTIKLLVQMGEEGGHIWREWGGEF